MKIAFHGAARTVTGSKHLLTLKNSKKILLDCGLFQGGKESFVLNQEFGFDPKEVNAMILSHAHIDHSGLIPKLVKEGFKGPIFCSIATLDMATILLRDSAKIQEDDTKYMNKSRKEKHLPFLEPLYTVEDVESALPFLVPMKMDVYFDVLEGVKCMLTEAGHILGSNIVNLKITEDKKERHLCFTGDIGRYNDPILKSPAPFPQAEIIICESTYGDTLHDDLAISDTLLIDEITNTCIQKRGKLLIPSFSVGRTQEIVYALNRLDIENKLPNIKFYVDSPLSYLATEVTRKHKECFNKSLLKFMEKDKDPFEFKNLHFITEIEESKALNSSKEPCVIISASGMADAGRIKHHIANNINNAKNTILIVGYCEPNSLGARLQTNAPQVKIFGQYYDKNAEIKKIKSFSAHADYSDIFQFLSCQDPLLVDKFFIVHGEYDVQLNFKKKLLKKGFDFIEIPEIHSEYSLR